MTRRIVAMVVALAVVAGVGLPAAAQDAPAPPGTPFAVTARAADGRAHVVWSMPGTPPTGPTGGFLLFTVTPYIGRVAQPATVVSGRCCADDALVEGLANGTAYRFTVTAEDIDTGATSNPSARSAAVRPQPWGPFASPERLTRRMHQLFAFRRSTPAEDAAWRQAMDGGTRAADLVVDLIEDGVWDDAVGAVVRTYTLALRRRIDIEGLHYWRDELLTGRRTLSQVARAIGTSAEFRDHNDQPTDEWLRFLYRSATNRWPSTSDQAYWEAEMARGVPRWKVVLLFSQSAEHRPLSRDHTGYYSIHAGFDDAIPDDNHSWADLSYLGSGELTLQELVDEQLLGVGRFRPPPI